jgi:hypothetical protein
VKKVMPKLGTTIHGVSRYPATRRGRRTNVKKVMPKLGTTIHDVAQRGATRTRAGLVCRRDTRLEVLSIETLNALLRLVVVWEGPSLVATFFAFEPNFSDIPGHSSEMYCCSIMK